MLSLLPLLSGTFVFKSTGPYQAYTSQHVVQNIEFSPLQDNKDYCADESLLKQFNSSSPEFNSLPSIGYERKES
jgi:hypothetical protein